MKTDLKSNILIVLLLCSNYLSTKVNPKSIDNISDNPMISIIMTQIQESHSQKKFISKIVNIVDGLVNEYESDIKQSEKEVQLLQSNCTLGNLSLAEKIGFYKDLDVNFKKQLSMINVKNTSNLISDYKKEIENLIKEKNDYEFIYERNKENYNHLLNITKHISDDINYVSKYYNMLFMGTLPDNRDPLSVYEKKKIYKKMRPSLSRLNSTVKEIILYYDNKELNATKDLNSSLERINENGGNFLLSMNATRHINKTLRKIFSYHKEHNNFFSNATRVLFFFDTKIQSKKKLLQSCINDELFIGKDLSQNLKILGSIVKNSTIFIESTLKSFQLDCVDKLNNLKSNIKRK